MKRLKSLDPAAVRLFWEVLRSGGVVVYPTDTLYGFGVDALNASALAHLQTIKGRSGPFSVMVGTLVQLGEFALVSPDLADKFGQMLPGPYTLILPPANPALIPDEIKDPQGKTGFRVPRHAFIQRAYTDGQGLVVTTSVNLTGQEPLRDPDEIAGQFGDSVDLLLDDGKLSASKGSTVIDPSERLWKILRQGDGEI